MRDYRQCWELGNKLNKFFNFLKKVWSDNVSAVNTNSLEEEALMGHLSTIIFQTDFVQLLKGDRDNSWSILIG